MSATDFKNLKQDLLACGQKELFELPSNPERHLPAPLVKQLLEELHSLHYPGGAAGYIIVAQGLLGTLPSPPPQLHTTSAASAAPAVERDITSVELPSKDLMMTFPNISDPSFSAPAQSDHYTLPSELAAKLKDKKEGESPLVALERYGLSLVRDTIVVLVAGGLGERLGYNGIKVELPTDTASMIPFIQHYLDYLRVNGRGNPFVIMTSDDTHTKTINLLRDNNCFGYDPKRVFIMKQVTVPCIANKSAKLAVKYGYPEGEGEGASPNSIQLLRKPHGHGDVHQLLYNQHEDSALTMAYVMETGRDSTGIAPRDAKGARLIEKWLKDEKYHDVCFIQDTNAFAPATMPFSLASMQLQNLKMVLTCTSRRDGEAVGVFCRQTFTNSQNADDILVRTGNVEYNLFGPTYDKIVKANPAARKEPDAEGNSPFPGSINTLLIDFESYVEALLTSEGKVSEFINPKYQPNKVDFKSPARIESLMQDIALVISDQLTQNGKKGFGDDVLRIGCTVFGRETYEPMKNFLDEGMKVEHTASDVTLEKDGSLPEGVKDLKVSVAATACTGSTCEECILNFNRNRFVGVAKSGEGGSIHVPHLTRSRANANPDNAGTFLYEKQVLPPTTVMVVAPSTKQTLPINLFPLITFDDAFGGSLTALRSHIAPDAHIAISVRSSLVIRGANIKIESLHLDGALEITNENPDKELTVRNLAVHNAGWKATPIAELPEGAVPDSVPQEFVKTRGYWVVKKETKFLSAEDAESGLLSGKL